jgi:hypothetical protein
MAKLDKTIVRRGTGSSACRKYSRIKDAGSILSYGVSAD